MFGRQAPLVLAKSEMFLAANNKFCGAKKKKEHLFNNVYGTA